MSSRNVTRLHELLDATIALVAALANETSNVALQQQAATLLTTWRAEKSRRRWPTWEEFQRLEAAKVPIYVRMTFRDQDSPWWDAPYVGRLHPVDRRRCFQINRYSASHLSTVFMDTYDDSTGTFFAYNEWAQLLDVWWPMDFMEQ